MPTRYFPEASSVSFRRSVTYGLATLNVVRRYLFHKWGLRRYPQFTKRLANVLARPYQSEILK